MNREFFISAWGCCLMQTIYSVAPPTEARGWLQAVFTLLAFISICAWGATRKDDE